MEKDKYVVIIAGGGGERFWPKSRLKTPKYTFSFVNNSPILAQTVDRLQGIIPEENIFIISNLSQLKTIEHICPQIPHGNIIAEPLSRDTAPAIMLAKALVKFKNPQATFAVLPADHVISDVVRFQINLKKAFEVATLNPWLVTFGIQPTYPATGYGYVKLGDSLPMQSPVPAFKVEQFVEKPSLEKATAYFNSCQYLWNSGIFVWNTVTLEKAFEMYLPTLYSTFSHFERKIQKIDRQSIYSLLKAFYPSLEKISIDFALMEKVRNIIALQASFGWDDIGEWNALHRHVQPDEDKNIVCGESITFDSHNNIISNENGHLTALVGVNDLIVVQTPDATLVCRKDRTQDVKKIVKKLSVHQKYSKLI